MNRLSAIINIKHLILINYLGVKNTVSLDCCVDTITGLIVDVEVEGKDGKICRLGKFCELG